MCTPVDDSIQFFDLELLYNSAATSLTENTNLIEDVNQNLNLLEGTEERNAGHRAELLNTLRYLEEKTKDNDQMRKWLEEKKKDYDQLKQQYIKLGQDYADLHFESKRNALDSITANTNLEKMTEEIKICNHKLTASENRYTAENTLRKAALSNAFQLTKTVEKLEGDKANLKNMNESYKDALKVEKRKVSRLTYKLKTYEADLFSMAGKLALTTDKKTRDRDTKRQISTYTNKKFNANLENIDNESIDTGRGSSFSNYSPAYSINFSPLNMTENFEQKMMKDASTSTSTLQTNETFHLSKRSITSPSIVDGTKPLENLSVNVISSKENITTRDTASSPISFVNDMKEKITTVDTASSPISFVDVIEQKITTVNTASSPISFVNNSSHDMSKNKITSGIRSPAARAKMRALDSSPKSMDVANSPIYVANPSSPTLISPSWECTASPIEFTSLKSADVTIPANEINDISRPLEPTAVPFKPAAVTTPMVQTPEMTRSRKPNAVTNPVVQTPEMNRPLQSTDVVERSIDKTPQRNRLDPTVGPRPTVKTPDLSMQLKPMAVTKLADLLTRPNDVKRQSLTIKTPEMARPIETIDYVNQEAKTTTSEHVVSLVNNNVSVITKTPVLNNLINAAYVRTSVIQTPPRSMKHADARRPLMTTKPLDETKQNENIKILSPEIFFKEIQSIAQDYNQERDDMEVEMILNKIRLDWNALSPLSITPDLDEECLKQFNSDVRINETERQSSQCYRSEISKESDSLFVIVPDYNKLPIPQNKSNNLKHKIKEDNPSHIKKNKVLKPISNLLIRHTPVHKENERRLPFVKATRLTDKTIQLIKRKARVKINYKITKREKLFHTSRNNVTESQESIKKEYLHHINQVDSIVSKPPERRRSERLKSIIPAVQYLKISKELQSDTCKPPERRRSERIKSPIPSPPQSKTKSVPQTQTKLQSSPMSILKEPESNTRSPLERRRSERIKSIISSPPQSETNSVPHTQTKLQSSSIDKMTISKEPQSNTHNSPERRRSERIKSTISSLPQSKTNSVPKNQTKLQPSPMSISKEPQSNTRNSLERRTSERIKFTISSAQSETNSEPQNQTKLQSSPMPISKEPQSNPGNPPERRTSERIKFTISSAQSETNSEPQDQKKLQSNPMSISKEPQSNPVNPPERRTSARIKSTVSPAESETNSVPQNPTKLQSCLMSISKEPQSYPGNLKERRISERKESKISPAQSETNNVPQNQTKLLSGPISISKETQSNTRNPPEIRTSERIKSTISPAESETNSVSQNQTKLQSSLMSISKEPLSYPFHPPERGTSERTISPAQFETNSVPQNQVKLLSSPMSISKEPQSNPGNPPERRTSEMIESTIFPAQSETNSVSQNQAKLQSSPMSISKEPQSTPSNPPERQTSEKIKSTICPAQSKTNNVPQNQTKLQSSLIDNMSNSKGPQSNTRSGCSSIISNPEYGRKRTICRSMEARSDHKHTKSKKNKECDTNKLNSAEICSENKFTYSYSKPLKERISRVKSSVSSNTEIVLNNKLSEDINGRKETQTIDKNLAQTQSTPQSDTTPQSQTTQTTPASKRAVLADNTEATEIIIKDFGCTSASKRAKLTDDTTGFVIKPGLNMNENDNTKMSINHASASTKDENPEANVNFVTDDLTKWTTYESSHLITLSEIELSQNGHGRYCADYNDINIFNTDNINLKTRTTKMNKKETYEWTHNLLDKMIFKYGSNRKNMNKSCIIIKDRCEDEIAKEIEVAVSTCVSFSAYPNKYLETLKLAADKLKKHPISEITGALSKYLKNSNRKAQFLPGNKNRNYRFKPTPTKYVISFMDIIDRVDKSGIKLWETVLNSCRHILFNLDRNATPSLDVVESVTHLFVNMCQFNGRRNAKAVIIFMMAAMYCANYRAIIIIKHCLDLVPEILPHLYETPKILDHMKPLFQTFIFLLHFYKCDDQFGKVQGVRFTLKKRYGYDPTQDNDTTILHLLKQAIIKITDHYLEIAMLEYSILILAKRKGTKWCHANIVQKILLPIIKGEVYASKGAFRFCLTIITKVLKPYNKEMIVHSIEVVNLLMNIIEQPHPQELKDDIICGMLCLSMKTVTDRINIFLANWNPPSISPKLEKALEKYIERKPLKHWRYVHQFITEQ